MLHRSGSFIWHAQFHFVFSLLASVNLMKINTITSLLMTSFIIFIILDIPRQTDEEKEFGDFQLFDDPNRPYSTFNFKYSPLAFDRMTQLMEYNTLRFKNLIMEKIRENVRKYQNSSIRRPIKLKDIKKLRLDQKDKEDRLKQFVQSFDHPDSE
jgi:hypothetical protein